MPATFGVVLAAARIPAMIFTPLQFPSKNHKPYLLLKITKCSLLSSSSSSLSPLLSPPVLYSLLLRLDSLSCPLLSFFVLRRPLARSSRTTRNPQTSDGRKKVPHEHDMQPTSILFLIFVANLRIVATEKNSVRIVKGTLFWEKKTLKTRHILRKNKSHTPRPPSPPMKDV